MKGLPVRDQRTMTGDRQHETVADVESYWRAWAANKGFPRRTGVRLHALNVTDLESRVYISAGCFVADCPNKPDCNGAAACWTENPRACCLSCGTVFKVVWPTEEEMGGTLHDALEVLAERPKAMWLNFRASNPDETIDDLKAQNLAMGDALPGGKPAKGPHPLDATLVRG